MKNGLVIWNVLLTLLSGYLLYAHFSNKDKGVSTSKGSSFRISSDSASNSKAGSIAYFEMDSVEAHFKMVKDVQAEIQSREKDYSNDLAQLDASYRKKIQGYQEKGTSMTPDEYQKAQIDLKQTEEYLKGRKQEIDRDFQEFVTKRNLGLKKEIEDFIATYNKDKNYSYIMVYEPGLFYYKDTAYNITSDVIRGLNEIHTARKKK